MNRKYPINHAERFVTKFGPTVLMSIRDAPFHVMKVFVPKRYGSTFSVADIEDINTVNVSLHLIYKGHVIKLNRTSWPLKRKIDDFVLHVYM